MIASWSPSPAAGNQLRTAVSSPMLIPYSQLSPKALRGIVQEFVTRDGTDHTSVEKRIEAVLRHLAAGRMQIHFDDETETCNILPV